jgi:uncharacterized UBP type Zn finger protein
LEQNQNFNFNMFTEDGKSFEPLFGPGYTGFKNLGNRYGTLSRKLSMTTRRNGDAGLEWETDTPIQTIH